MVVWQLNEESDLFKIIHRKNEQDLELTKEETSYYNYYRYTFWMELGSFSLTFPIGLVGYKFHLEKKRPFKVIKNLNFYLAALIFSSLPAIHLYTWAIYRRYFAQQQYEKELMQLHQQELQQLNRQHQQKKSN